MNTENITREEHRRRLTERLGREPSDVEVVKDAQRRRHERKVTDGGLTLAEYLKRRVYRRLSGMFDRLERDGQNALVPRDVSAGLPLTEEEVRDAYDGVLQRLRSVRKKFMPEEEMV